MKKILVCDDDPGILEVIKIMLESSNFEVITLNNGRHILDKVKEFKPNLLLVDAWMPGIGGEEISKILRKDPVTKDLPVVIVSALNQGEIEQAVKRCAASGYLLKPFDMGDLLATVNKYAA